MGPPDAVSAATAYPWPSMGPTADHGHPIHYSAIQRGTPIYSADGIEVGKVDEVIDNYEEHILDGIVFEDPDGRVRFADGPEVSRTFERGVILAISTEEAEALPPPQVAPPRFRPNRGGRLRRLIGGGWRKH